MLSWGCGGRSTPVPHLQDAKGTGRERVKLASGTPFFAPIPSQESYQGPNVAPICCCGGQLGQGPGGRVVGIQGGL